MEYAPRGQWKVLTFGLAPGVVVDPCIQREKLTAEAQGSQRTRKVPHLFLQAPRSLRLCGCFLHDSAGKIELNPFAGQRYNEAD